jgi:hypothetical protein
MFTQIILGKEICFRQYNERSVNRSWALLTAYVYTCTSLYFKLVPDPICGIPNPLHTAVMTELL